MSSDNFSLKWGIASCGMISSDFVNAMQVIPHQLNKVVAVAARKLEDAKAFANKFSIPTAFGSYEELAQSPDVDVVYIGTIHPKHYSLATMYLNAGKHVLCEKPLGMNAREVKEMVKLARNKGLFFMEGFWSRFFPAYDKLRSALAEKQIGDVQMASATIGFNGRHMSRLTKKELGGGALLDCGCYPIQFAQLIFKDKPLSIKCTGSLTDEGVDESMSAVLTYPGGRIATITACLCAAMLTTATVSGTNGLIKLEKFWCPLSIEINEEKKDYPIVSTSGMNYTHCEGFQYEIEHVRHCIEDGLKESPLMTLDESITIAEISDEIRRQLGVVYDADSAK